jgi:hypothetical protein
MSDEKKPATFSAFVAFDKASSSPTGEYVRGWLSVSTDAKGNPVVDDQDDQVVISEITKAAHVFISKSRDGKVMHKGQPVGEFVESVIIDDEFAAAHGIVHKQRGWWGTFHVLDADVRKDVVAGKFKGFSIGGDGTRVTRRRKK